MSRKALALGLIAALTWVPPAIAQNPSSDPDVLKGIRQVEDGDYDPAIVTLDAAARRLAADPGHARDLSQAYLYLGIAYIGKGHEAAAKAKFREAVAQIKDLTLSPDKFPPKVIDLFEAAREEAQASASPVPAATPASAAVTPPAAPAKKGGGSKGLLIAGGLVAVGGGIALAAGGGSSGGSGSSSSGATASTTPSPSPSPTVNTLQRQDSVPDNEQRFFTVTASKAGTLQAKVVWSNRNVRLTIDCQESNAPYTQCAGNYVRVNDTEGTFSAPVTQKEYLVIVSNYSGQAGAEPFTVQIQYP